LFFRTFYFSGDLPPPRVLKLPPLELPKEPRDSKVSENSQNFGILCEIKLEKSDSNLELVEEVHPKSNSNRNRHSFDFFKDFLGQLL